MRPGRRPRHLDIDTDGHAKAFLAVAALLSFLRICICITRAAPSPSTLPGDSYASVHVSDTSHRLIEPHRVQWRRRASWPTPRIHPLAALNRTYRSPRVSPRPLGHAHALLSRSALPVRHRVLIRVHPSLRRNAAKRRFSSRRSAQHQHHGVLGGSIIPSGIANARTDVCFFGFVSFTTVRVVVASFGRRRARPAPRTNQSWHRASALRARRRRAHDASLPPARAVRTSGPRRRRWRRFHSSSPRHRACDRRRERVPSSRRHVHERDAGVAKG